MSNTKTAIATTTTKPASLDELATKIRAARADVDRLDRLRTAKIDALPDHAQIAAAQKVLTKLESDFALAAQAAGVARALQPNPQAVAHRVAVETVRARQVAAAEAVRARRDAQEAPTNKEGTGATTTTGEPQKAPPPPPQGG
jgi:hypothetical protein